MLSLRPTLRSFRTPSAATPAAEPRPTSRRTWTIASLVVATFAWAAVANAQVPPPVFVPPASTQFDISGFLQAATLGGPGTGSGTGAHQGGTLTVNGHLVIVPSETIVILPASALTWQELFAQAPPPYTGTATGMAMADTPRPISTYEVHVVGNRVGDAYIAGLIDISQNGLNSGAGYINYIDYALGEMRVGGLIGSNTTGARVRLNDPTGRYGRIMTPDQRFTVDADNPTIAAGTGFPMCFPRTDPAIADDPLCPQANRPLDGTGNFAISIQMNDPVALAGVFPDATKQAPLEVGDYVTFAGTLVNDSATPTVAVAGSATYISAHTISNNAAIYTWPGTNPAYVSTEVALIGTGGLTVVGAGEAAIRTRFEGMTTDPSRRVHLYGIDLDPLTGATTDRDWGFIGVDQGPPVGAVKGRWRFRPPCLAFGSVPTKPDKECVFGPTGGFLPPTREVRAVVEGAWVPGQTSAYANGIIAGQYHAPILEYIFPENVPGSPIVENNFNSIDFLAKGGYTSAAGTVAGVLNPWPSNVTPIPACTPVVANAGGPYTAAANGSITLAGSAGGTLPVTFLWTAVDANNAPVGTFSNASIANPVFTAPSTGPVNLTLVATNTCGATLNTSTSNTTVTVNPPLAPTVAHVAPITVFSGGPGSFVVSATDPNVPAAAPLTFSVTQTGAPALVNLVVGAVTCLGSTCSATVTFTAPTLPVGSVTSDVVSLTIRATNSIAQTSAAEFTSVTVNPLPDAVTITAGGTEYRIGKQRLTINATSSVISPNVVLTLQPYVTATGTIFDPATLGAVFTNNGGGLYILTLVGAPEPAVPPATPLTVKSNLGTTSAPHGLDRIRQ